MKFLFFCTFLFLFSCNSKISDFNSIPFDVTPVIEEAGDGSYFSQISSISVYDSNIFLADYKNGRVLRYDSSFNFLNPIGSPGQGPNEFSGLYYLFASQDGVHAYDGALKTMKEFDFQGNLKNTTPFPSLAILSSFCYIDGNYFFSPYSSSGLTALQSFSREGELIHEITLSTKDDWPAQFHLAPLEIEGSPFLLALDATNAKAFVLEPATMKTIYSESLLTFPSALKTYDALKKRQKNNVNQNVIAMLSGVNTEKNMGYVFGGNIDENYIIEIEFGPKGLNIKNVLTSNDKQNIFAMSYGILNNQIYIYNERHLRIDRIERQEG